MQIVVSKDFGIIHQYFNSLICTSLIKNNLGKFILLYQKFINIILHLLVILVKYKYKISVAGMMFSFILQIVDA